MGGDTRRWRIGSRAEEGGEAFSFDAMLNDAHHTPSNNPGPARATHDRHAQPAPRPRRDTAFGHDSGVKSATRALEVIELFAVRREALSVSEIAGALEIPQSSSSVLLQAMRKAGFIDRNRQTRKYLPSIRSVFLGNSIYDTLFQRGSFLRALDTLSDATGANVRLGVLNGIHVRYAHISWPGGHPGLRHLRPGMLIPICQDALGRMLLVGAGEREARGIVRHANADAPPDVPPVNVEDFMASLAECRGNGHAECLDFATHGECVLAVQLPAPFGVPAAIGLGVAAARLVSERAQLLEALRAIADAWSPQGIQRRPANACD